MGDLTVPWPGGLPVKNLTEPEPVHLQVAGKDRSSTLRFVVWDRDSGKLWGSKREREGKGQGWTRLIDWKSVIYLQIQNHRNHLILRSPPEYGFLLTCSVLFLSLLTGRTLTGSSICILYRIFYSQVKGTGFDSQCPKSIPVPVQDALIKSSSG